ncbi:MAG TPA: PTS sugar transporter subunit IIC [Longimicrobiales bacterium]|nr:PTS sugar transporter subunit IIC [Longimicrobiales bacterium]
MTLVILSVLGAVVALDATSFGQLMLSRPLVAGTLAGAIVGMPREGALIGALIEVLSLGILPVGAARYPETGTAAVAAVGSMGLAGINAGPELLLLVLAWGLIWQRLFGITVVAERYLNERLVHAGEELTRNDLHDRIERWHLTSMSVDLLRGALMTAIAIIIGAPVLRLAVTASALPELAATLGIGAAAAAVLMGTARVVGESRALLALLGAGAALGSLLLWVR